MNTIEELKSGKLKGIKRLKIASGLLEFPKEIFEFAETLEILDLTGNKLSFLPDEFSTLHKLKIVFLSENQFTKFPSILGKCQNLEMIGFKSNRISQIEENAFPVKTRWLILTDNKLTSIPKSISKCTLLQKCMLAGNLLSSLPTEMKNCKNLELLRISANQFQEIPDWLFSLPKLSWLACAGNPVFEKKQSNNIELPIYNYKELQLKELLGQGASGLIYKVLLPNQKEAALKIFKGELTSDGLPEDELKASRSIPMHPYIVSAIGEIENHPEHKKGLLLKLIPPNYKNLGNPPSLKTCTRDTFSDNTVFKPNEILALARKMVSIANHLIENGILHGDFYTHNTLIDENFNPLFGDFGAALLFDKKDLELKSKFEKIEVRAFGSFLDDLLSKTNESNQDKEKIQAIIDLCFQAEPSKRPTFTKLKNLLHS